MTIKPTSKASTYTCADYRLEMRLLGARKQLNNPKLTEEERERLQKEIDVLEKEIGFED